jgi:release factor glutamine methyltransferase
MTGAQAGLDALRRQLAPASPTADLDAQLLLAHVLGINRSLLAADPGRPLGAAQAQALAELVRRRVAGEPVAYLTGRREFWSLDIEVTPDVLVPRPETELLVELALARLSSIRGPAVLDLGTGSGAIALAIARERPDAVVTAVDLFAAALAVAERNAARLGIGNAHFRQGSWYEAAGGARQHAIVSNPPYVTEDDPALAALAHEPRAALVAGADGLDALRTICAGAPARLAAGGVLIVEHGATQGAAVRALMTQAGLVDIATYRDLAGHERASCGILARTALQSGFCAGEIPQ